MVEMVTMSFDEQVTALLERDLVEDEVTFWALLESARPEEPAARSVLTVSREVVSVAAAAARVELRGREVLLGHLTSGRPRIVRAH
jgi:hypothetical protein